MWCHNHLEIKSTRKTSRDDQGNWSRLWCCWEYLDSVYRDPRFVADIITQDISKFKPIKDGEDAQFCDLVHLVKRSFNMLKEVGHENDNNNHMLAIIEQKMFSDNCKVWSHHLESTRSEATLEVLPGWQVNWSWEWEHVRCSNPMDMTDFWTTESMGVEGKMCSCDSKKLSPIDAYEAKIIEDSCKKIGNQWLIPYPWVKNAAELPDNRTQAERKLEATERRLAKNPNHAEAYNKQMGEMSEMNFCRKLSNEELESYKRPVHYISHHEVVRPKKKSTPIQIVFNFSASYKGQRLNDYWMKGPDLLSSLFRVLLRFWEN